MISLFVLVLVLMGFVFWMSNEPTEIVTLRTGEKIILEGEWNMEVHNSLNNNRTELALPKPKRRTFSFEIY